MEKKDKPEKRIRLGNICAAIWRNENGKGKVWRSVTIARSYRDGDAWKDTTSFSRDDLPVAGAALDMAHSWIWERERAPEPEEEAEE